MRTHWTQDEVDRLITLFPTHTTQAIADILGRPLMGVRDKCYNLRLKKSPDYRKAYLAINRAEAIKVQVGGTPWNKQPPVTLCCKWCKEEFSVPVSRRKAVFCGRPCMTAWRKTVTGEAHWLDTKIDCTCKWCHAVFRVKKAKVGYGEGHYCSRRCLGSALSYSMGLQKGPTGIERKMEQALISRNINYIAQYAIGAWCVDFYLPDLNMVIECDGDYWHSLPEVIKRDKGKSASLKSKGYILHRIKENDINKKLEEVLNNILLNAQP